jgi:hypothetical protein
MNFSKISWVKGSEYEGLERLVAQCKRENGTILRCQDHSITLNLRFVELSFV